MNTFVFSKDAGDIISQQALVLNAGEVISSITQGPVNPSSANAPVLTLGPAANPVQFTITGGDEGVSYGWPLTVTTNQRTLVVTFAVVVVQTGLAPGLNSDPDSYQTLIGELQAGHAAIATTMFQLPLTVDPAGGFVTWDILDENSTVYASGNAFAYNIKNTANGSVVIARSVVSVPSNIPQSLDAGYQLRYTLQLADGSISYSYESLRVTGFPEMQLGAVDSMEMQGDLATLSLVTADLYVNYVLEIRKDGELLASMPVGNPERVANGYFIGGVVDTTNLPVSCEPYQIIWKYWTNPAQTFREAAALWIVNDSIIQAVEDVKSKVNKARQTLYGTDDSQFPGTEVMKWLRRGMDLFNGAYGQFTFFTMTKAKGVVREFWLLCAEKAALDAQYLMEGEKAFNFQGANISLDVDRTQYLDNMAGKIQGQLDNELKPIKVNLIIKGQTKGDGSGIGGDGDFSKAAPGATGGVGIAITPASIYGNFPWPLRSGVRI